jgi:Concanavalin A-like lectin/glucanases superfamily
MTATETHLSLLVYIVYKVSVNEKKLNINNQTKMKKQALRNVTFVGFLAALMMGVPPGACAQTLTHRYSFNDPPANTTFADSVGSSTWDGTLQGGAVLNGNSLVLDGLGSWATLPSGLITGYTQISIEFWADLGPGNPVWTRVFAFGDQNGGGGKNTGLDYCHYAGGNWQNLDLSTAGVDAWANNSGGIEGTTNVHVTVVVDPVANTMYYYNGTKVASDPGLNNGAGGTVSALSGINDTLNLIGMSLYASDPTVIGSIHEFRIYSGVLTPSIVALGDAAGPDNLVTNPGPVQALHFSSPVNPLVVNQSSQQILTGDFTNLTGLNLILYGGATFTSQNTSVLTINSTNGTVKAFSAGTTKVVASFGGLSATNSLTVVSLPAVLTHRYSFTNDASDSAGGANGTLMGSATVSGGQLVLDGSAGTYLDLPGNIINIPTNTAVTFETWVTFGNQSLWSYLFGFGNRVGGNGVNQIALVPCPGGGGFHHWGITENFAGGRTPSWAHGWFNLTAHITCVVDPPTSTISIYRDGVLEFAQYDASAPLSNVPTNFAYLGKSFYDADPYQQASIDEFRIYSGALTPGQVALTHLGGPGSTSLELGALSSIVVVPTNYPAFAASVPPVILANYAHLPNFNLLATVTAGGNATLTGPQGLVITSSDPNIVSVSAQNMLTTHRPGTVTLSASYLGKTSSATIRVKNEATLTHQYSFTSDASDSVGGANGTLAGAATIASGQLQLTGNNADYLTLPPGLLQDYNSSTIDLWVNLGSAQSWARLWEFADIGPGTENEFYFAPGWGNPPDAHNYNAGFPVGGNSITAGALGNQALHLTCLYGDGSMEVYRNGVLDATLGNLIAPASQAGTISATIGHSPFNDPGINGSVDEFRIYRGKLSAEEIAASQFLGPDQRLSTVATLTAIRVGGNALLSWLAAAAGFAVETSTSLSSPINWVTLTNAPALVGSNWQLSVPASGTAQFFRLIR